MPPGYGPGMFNLPAAAKQFLKGKLHSLPCRWCNELLSVKSSGYFLCRDCDWAPHAQGATPPRGIL